jgi:hypothetical protein
VLDGLDLRAAFPQLLERKLNLIFGGLWFQCEPDGVINHDGLVCGVRFGDRLP